MRHGFSHCRTKERLAVRAAALALGSPFLSISPRRAKDLLLRSQALLASIALATRGVQTGPIVLKQKYNKEYRNSILKSRCKAKRRSLQQMSSASAGRKMLWKGRRAVRDIHRHAQHPPDPSVPRVPCDDAAISASSSHAICPRHTCGPHLE